MCIRRIEFSLRAALFIVALAGARCGGALPHELEAPPLPGTIEVDVARDGRWVVLPESAWTLRGPCSLRVTEAGEGELVRVRYSSEPRARCRVASPSVVQIGDVRQRRR